MAEADLAENDRRPVTPTLDIAAFVEDATNLQRKFRYIGFVWMGTNYILSWKTPWISALSFIFAELLCVWPTLLPFLVLLVVGILFSQTLVSVPASVKRRVSAHYSNAAMYTTSEDDDVLSSQMNEARQRTEVLHQYRENLITIHARISFVLCFLGTMNSIFLWEDRAIAGRWCTGLVVSLLAMIFFPLQWVAAVLVLLLFLYNPHFFAVLRRRPANASKPEPGPCDQDPVTLNNENDEGGHGTDDRSSPDNAGDQIDATLSETEEMQEDSMASGSQPAATAGKPGVVSRLKALRQRRKITKEALCAGCLVSLSGILRKRCYCRHCGQDFCANCCNKEVPRALLGATAPAAKRETVLVCNTCHDFLTADSEAERRVRQRALQAQREHAAAQQQQQDTAATSI